MIEPDVLPPHDQPVYWIMVDGSHVVDTASHEDKFKPPFLKASEVPESDLRYTARIGEYLGKDVFLLIREADTSLQEGWEIRQLRQCLLRADEYWFGLAARGCQIAGFLRTHKFCGVCGHENSQDREELAVVCGYCGLTSYPRISPCIIVVIYNGKQILLGRGVGHPEGVYSAFAGFVESGESLEDTLHREVMEETGVKVKNLEYVFSQPWPFPHSLMAGFIAEYDSGELEFAPDEIIEGGWFNYDDLPNTPPRGTIAAKLIKTTQLKVQCRN